MSNDTDFLLAAHNAGYGPQPIPVERDRQIIDHLRSALAAKDISDLRSKVDQRHEATLCAFAERMATLALREKSGGAIEMGLVALSLGGLKRPSPEALMALSLLIDAARRIGELPERFLGQMAGQLGQVTESAVLSFLARSEEDQSITAMGFELASDCDGPRYVLSW